MFPFLRVISRIWGDYRPCHMYPEIFKDDVRSAQSSQSINEAIYSWLQSEKEAIEGQKLLQSV